MWWYERADVSTNTGRYGGSKSVERKNRNRDSMKNLVVATDSSRG